MTATRRLLKLLNNVNNVTLSQNDLNRLSDEQDSIINNLSKLSGKKIQIPRIKYEKFIEDLDGIDFLKLNNIPDSSRKSNLKKTVIPRRKSNRKSSRKLSLKKTVKPRRKSNRKSSRKLSLKKTVKPRRKSSRKSSLKKTVKPRRKSSPKKTVKPHIKSSPKKTVKPRRKQRKKTLKHSSLKMTTKTVNRGKGKRKVILCLMKEI